jgi:fructose-1,6-bisphosphatase-3
MVADTDTGRALRETIRDLEALLAAYREGTIVEKDGRRAGGLNIC